MKPLYLVTDRSCPALSEDDQLLAASIEARGVPVRAVVWNDAAVCWSGACVALLRSTWDYHRTPIEFLDWLARIEPDVRVINNPHVIRWNINKRYLKTLERAGITIIPTMIVAGGRDRDLEDLVRRSGWPSAVIKPSISCDAHATRLFRGLDTPEGMGRFLRYTRTLHSKEESLIQPVMEEVFRWGEISLVYFSGVFSHAIRRKVKECALRNTVLRESYLPTQREVSFGSAILDASNQNPVYARVDIVQSPAGAALMELELIEPALHFRYATGAADRFAQILVREALQYT